MTEFLFGLSGHSGNAVLVTHVEFEGDGASSKRAYLRLEGQQTSAIPAGENKIGAGFCESTGKVLAKPPACTCNDRHTATQIEERSVHENSPGVRTTFIKFGSRACKRSNHCGPSSSGATAVIRGCT